MGSYGKHTRNPGYKHDHWIECQVCGFEIRSSEAKERWDGLIVCPEDFELRHPQEFIRVPEEDQAAKGLVAPKAEPSYVSVTFVEDPNKTIPSGTFTTNNETLE